MRVPTIAGIVLVVLACGGGTEPGASEPAPVPPAATLTASSQAVIVGDQVTLTWSCSSATSAERSWTAAGTTQLSGSDTVSAPAIGTITFALTCRGKGGSVTALSRVDVNPVPSISGQLYNLTGNASCLSDSRVRIQNGAFRDSSEVAVDGTYRMTNRSLAGIDSVDLVVDEKASLTRHCFPTLLALHKADYGKRLDFVRVPTSWTVRKGVYVGTITPISLDLAYTPSDDGKGSAFYPRGIIQGKWDYLVNQAVAEGNFPMMRAFDRAHSNQTITASDSVAHWLSIDSLEKVFGEDFFKPANITDLPIYAGSRVVVDSTTLYSGGVTSVGQNGDITGIGMWINYIRFFSDIYGIIHESIHGFGFGHTCSWPSIMEAGCGSMGSNVATDHDVAYKELMYETAHLRAKKGIQYGIPEAHQGERVFMLNLPREVIGYK